MEGEESNLDNAPRAPLSDKEKKTLEKTKRHSYRIHNGLLFRICHTFAEGVDDGPYLRLCVPSRLRVALIKEMHSEGHLGPTKTIRRLQRNYFWPTMKQDVRERSALRRYVIVCLILGRFPMDHAHHKNGLEPTWLRMIRCPLELILFLGI